MRLSFFLNLGRGRRLAITISDSDLAALEKDLKQTEANYKRVGLYPYKSREMVVAETVLRAAGRI
jgi:hypothetical protein